MIRKASSAAIAPPPIPEPPPLAPGDFGRVRGQEAAKRAFAIALAGSHSLACIGPPGQGKSMLIEAARAIEPGFQAQEVTLWPPCKNDVQRQKLFAQRLSALGRKFEIHIEVPVVPFCELTGKRRGTDTAAIRRTMAVARDFAAAHPGLSLELSQECLLLLKQAYQELGLTPHGYDVVCRLARTIASMDQSEQIQVHHVAEAVQYRLFDRGF